MSFEFFDKSTGKEPSSVPHRPASDSDPLADASIGQSINPYASPNTGELSVKDVVKKLDRVVSAIEAKLAAGGLVFDDFCRECFSILSHEGLVADEYSPQSIVETFQFVEGLKRYRSLEPLLGNLVKGFEVDFVATAEAETTEYMAEQAQEYLEARLTIRRCLNERAKERSLDAEDIIEEVESFLAERFDISPARRGVLQKYLQTEMANDFSYSGIVGKYPRMSPLLFASAEFLDDGSARFARAGSEVDAVTLTDAVAILAMRRS